MRQQTVNLREQSLRRFDPYCQSMKLPFEIHITVENSKGNDFFVKTCAEIGVKPIILDLEKNGDVVMVDVMTSSVHQGNDSSAYEAAYLLADKLKGVGYNVLRVKIETVPWHPAAPKFLDENSKLSEDKYFESHLRIVTTEERKVLLEKIARDFGAHLSRNYFKKLNNNEYIIMMTLRKYEVYAEYFKTLVNALNLTLKFKNFVVDKCEIEFVIYDSKVSHDANWIK